MKIKKNIVLLIALVMALLIAMTGCGGARKLNNGDKTAPSDAKTEKTDPEGTLDPGVTMPIGSDTDPEQSTEPPAKTEPDKTEPDTTEPDTTEPDTTEPDTTAPENTEDDNVETVEAKTKDTAAGIGQWVSTLRNGNDMVLGKIRYRITNLSDDKEAIMALIEEYNKDDDNFRKVDTNIPENTTLKLCEYEVVYASDFPGYGDDNTIYSPDIYFTIAAENGGLDTADGYSHIGLKTVDISKKVKNISTGVVFQGRIIFAIPNNAVEQ